MQTLEPQVPSKDFVINLDEMGSFSLQHGSLATGLATFAEEARNTIHQGGSVEVRNGSRQLIEHLRTLEEVNAWEKKISSNSQEKI
jgi:hypothetical protein